MCKQLAESQHQTIHEREKEVDGGAAQDAPDSRGLVEDHGGAGRRRGQFVVGGVVLRVGGNGDAGLIELAGRVVVVVGRHDAGDGAVNNGWRCGSRRRGTRSARRGESVSG